MAQDAFSSWLAWGGLAAVVDDDGRESKAGALRDKTNGTHNTSQRMEQL